MKRVFAGTVMSLLVLVSTVAFAGEKTTLREGWRLQSSAKISAAPDKLSAVGFDDSVWYPTTVPNTVLAALVENGVYPDPYIGMNITKIPGYVDGRWLRMPEDSPFYPNWWYRTEFTLPPDYQGKHLTLNLDGINFKANVWLDGKKIAGDEQIYGMFRGFEIDITGKVSPGVKSCLAVEIISPGKLPAKLYITKQVEATTGWDDHNPQPPDANMGIWQDVSVSATGPVDIKHPYVVTDLDLPRLDLAHLTVSTYAANKSDHDVTGTLTGKIENITFEMNVALKPGEEKLLKFTPAEFPQLDLVNPRLWWPNPVGPQNLYDLDLSFTEGGAVSDSEKVTFGVREVHTYINDEGWRAYQVNGKNILIRGGAWMTTDMLLRFSNRRYEALVRYAREANLNMLRSEGFSIRETDEFYSICDRLGVMVTQQIFGRSIPDEALAIDITRYTLLRIRNHPSLVHFLGHDETFPTPTLDKAYRDLIAELTPERTYQPHSGAFDVEERFETGGTRTGTLELWTYASPAQYYVLKIDGAWGFAQSGGIGGVFASKETIERIIPESERWPLWTPSWSLHTVIQGGKYFDKLLAAMNRRYGKPANFDDLVMTGHVMNYECARGMYEAYARNKYSATGITTWKYDAAWPAALTWAYIDYYLLTTGAYHGAKKACESVHVQYSYDDDSIWVVNSLYQSFSGLKVTARVLNFDLSEAWKKEATVDVGEDGKTQAFVVDFPKTLTRSYFLDLRLFDSSGAEITRNFYWLSTSREKPGRKYQGVVPLEPSSFSDHTMLRTLSPVELDLTCAMAGEENGDRIGVVTVSNPSSSLAFFIQLALTKGPGGMEVSPSYWQENDFSLLPGEKRELKVKFSADDLGDAAPVFRVGGWNVKIKECKP